MLITIIYSIPGIVALFWAVYLSFGVHKHLEPKRVMVDLLLLFAAASFLYAQYYNDYLENKILTDILYCSCALFCPAYYIHYIKTFTTDPEAGLSKTHLMVFPVLFTLVAFSVGVLSSPEDQMQYVRSQLLHSEPYPAHPSPSLSSLRLVLHYVYCAYFSVSAVIAIIYGIVKTVKYHKLLDDYYSNDHIGIRAMLHVVFVSTTALVLTPCLLLVRYDVADTLGFSIPSALLVSLIVFSVAYYTKRMNYTSVKLQEMLAETSPQVKTPAVPTDIKDSLLSCMDTEKPYLDPSLNIELLAAKLGTNRTYLSKTINSSFNCSFSIFVNNYRVEYAKRIMLDKPDIMLRDVAEESGFNNMNSFSAHFQRVTGKKPSEWRKAA